MFCFYDDGIIHRCIHEVEMISILEACYSCLFGGHHKGIQITNKILPCGYYWQTIHQDAHEFSKACDQLKKKRYFKET